MVVGEANASRVLTGDNPFNVLATQGAVRVVVDDGEIGWGVVERDYRRCVLPSPEER